MILPCKYQQNFQIFKWSFYLKYITLSPSSLSSWKSGRVTTTRYLVRFKNTFVIAKWNLSDSSKLLIRFKNISTSNAQAHMCKQQAAMHDESWLWRVLYICSEYKTATEFWDRRDNAKRMHRRVKAKIKACILPWNYRHSLWHSVSWSDNVSNLNSEGAGFESRPGHRITCLSFRVFPLSLKKISEQNLQLRHDGCLHIIGKSLYTLIKSLDVTYSELPTASLNKSQINKIKS
jgi:hypothetical protein